MSAPDEIPQQLSAHPVIGARVIVEILRHLAGVPPETVQLTPMRNKAAQFVMEKTLQKLEHQQAALVFPAPLVSIASLLHHIAKTENKILYMAQADWGAAKLLDRVFDRIIDVGKLDAEGVWLLNRFRLPLFHFALNDHSFFFARQNLARRFINAVTLHLLTTREPYARDMKFVLGGIAKRMHEAFDGTAGKFNGLCLEGQTWFATQQQRLQKAELKIRDLAETQSKRQQAEERVVDLLNRCLAGKNLPRMVVDFMQTEWRQTLLSTSMKEGEQGLNWKRQARLSESMVELALACHSEEGRSQYQNFLPSLLKGVNASLAGIHSSEAKIAKTIEPLELVLSAMLIGITPEMCSCLPLALPELKTSVYQVTLESSPLLDRVLALQPGEWVRFKTPEGQFEACALVVKGQDGEAWSFVNQSGQGIVRKSAQQLANLLSNGVLEIVGEGCAVDEALQQILADTLPALPKQKIATTSGLSAPGLSASSPPASSQPREEDISPSLVADVDSVLQSQVETLPNAERQLPLVSLSECKAAKDTAQDTGFSQEEPVPDELMQASLAAVDGLQVGARLVWYKTEEQDFTLKLAVKTRGSEKLVFVNHIGVKALETDRKSLACLIASGGMVIIDIGARFDSALERIVKQIQQDKK